MAEELNQHAAVRKSPSNVPIGRSQRGSPSGNMSGFHSALRRIGWHSVQYSSWRCRQAFQDRSLAHRSLKPGLLRHLPQCHHQREQMPCRTRWQAVNQPICARRLEPADAIGDRGGSGHRRGYGEKTRWGWCSATATATATGRRAAARPSCVSQTQEELPARKRCRRHGRGSYCGATQ